MRISEFCQIRIGHAFRRRIANVPGGSVKIIQPKNISSSGIIFFKNDEPWHMNVSTSKPLQHGEVLVVNRGRFASTVFNLHDMGPWIVPSSILILSIKDKSVLPEYVSLYFNSANGQKLFLRHFERTTVPFVSTNNLANMDIPVPLMEKQRALVDFEKTSREYQKLSNRKLELHKQILSHELTKAEGFLKRSKS